MTRPFIRGKIALGYLALALCVAICGAMLVYFTRAQVETEYMDLQLRAAARMQRAETVLFDALNAEGIPVETALDPNNTGLIGPEWTELTTTLGHLEAKRSSINPNFAALLVRYFVEAGLVAGDTVAVGTSGSFPGLALATFCAAEEMGLRVKCIASFGASMYGATRTDFTVPKMMRILQQAGLIHYELLAVSPGGNEDYGESALYANAREVIAELAALEGVEYIDFNDIGKSIARRLELFGEDVDCFVNVGGASANSGTSAYTLNFPNGLVTDPPRIPTTENRGLMYEYAARGVPVINMLNVRKLCADNGLPYDPVPLPVPGEGGVYYDLTYNRALALGFAALSLGVIALGRVLTTRAWRKSALRPNDTV